MTRDTNPSGLPGHAYRDQLAAALNHTGDRLLTTDQLLAVAPLILTPYWCSRPGFVCPSWLATARGTAMARYTYEWCEARVHLLGRPVTAPELARHLAVLVQAGHVRRVRSAVDGVRRDHWMWMGRPFVPVTQLDTMWVQAYGGGHDS